MPPPTSRHITAHAHAQPINGARYSPASFNPLKRARTPNNYEDRPATSAPSSNISEKESGMGDDRRRARLKDLHARSERMLKGLFGTEEEREILRQTQRNTAETKQDHAQAAEIKAIPSVKRNARNIDEDDYGADDDEDEEEDEVETTHVVSPLQNRNTSHLLNGYLPIPTPTTPVPKRANDPAKSSEEARKQLEEEKKAAENAAKESSQTLFYTLEYDRDAMLEQEKLDELDRQVEAEGGGGRGSGTSHGAPQQGTLSSTNLGASSLTLKHLIRRIDAKRDMVNASDQQLRLLMSEVRKNRSKWASEDRVGQEELYEAAERVLMELKAKTEWAAPFLQKVNKRDAPDYYNVIKHPMDIGTMLKKLKGLAYQSKKEFVDDLDLIWSNCLKYNAAPDHVLRKKAEHMKKETARYIPLIPDVIIKSRAEVEAEDRRQQTEFDDGEDSDEEPLRTARGRKAPGKSSKKGGPVARQAPSGDDDSTPAPEARPQPMSAVANLKNEFFRDADGGSSFGFSTPPGRTGTPVGGMNGFLGSAAPGSQADFSEFEMLDASVNGAALQPDDLEQEDEDFKTWKQVTKKDRAQVAAERHSLFKADKLNIEDPALLRSKAGMRRWMRLQKPSAHDGAASKTTTSSKSADEVGDGTADGTTLEEEIDVAHSSVLPDYYDVLAGVPHIDDRLVWREDSEGQVIDQKEECLRMVPEGYFTAPQSLLSSKIDANMRQMQETRKIVAKIAIVKQMQLQAQTYQNQFQKYEPEPFVESDIPPHVVSDDGPIMSPWLCRAALQRSVGKIFYLAGFEEFQPSALETMTDIVSEYMGRLVRDFNIYAEAPKLYSTVATVPKTATLLTQPSSSSITAGPTSPVPPKEVRKLKPRFTQEEALLHMLHQSGHDVDNLDSYITDDIDRLSSKLETHHSRTRDYLAELLRPALDPNTAGQDGAGVFNDGSEQFVGGDFAEDIGEDFFGFKELGLDKEFGMTGFSVPLHLLQSRMHSAYQPANAAATSATGPVMQQPQPYAPLTMETLEDQIGLVKSFFLEKLEKAGDQPLIEDDDLPPKQRFPRPRLPPTGKISSPRKRPIREQQMMARKKRRQEIEAEREREAAAANALANGGTDTGADHDTTNNTTAATAGASNTQDTIMVNGIDANVDANGDIDDDTPLETLQVTRKQAIKPLSKPKLEPSQSDSGGAAGGAKTGDPTKQAAKQNAGAGKAGGSSSGERGDEGEQDGGEKEKNGTNGMLSPESIVVAAH